MHEIVDDFSPSTLLRAMETNVQDAWVRLGRGLGAEIHDEPELLWFLSGIPFHLANGIMRAHFPSDAGEEILDEQIKQLTVHGVPMACRVFATWVSSGSTAWTGRRPTSISSPCSKG